MKKIKSDFWGGKTKCLSPFPKKKVIIDLFFWGEVIINRNNSWQAAMEWTTSQEEDYVSSRRKAQPGPLSKESYPLKLLSVKQARCYNRRHEEAYVLRGRAGCLDSKLDCKRDIDRQFTFGLQFTHQPCYCWRSNQNFSTTYYCYGSRPGIKVSSAPD